MSTPRLRPLASPFPLLCQLARCCADHPPCLLLWWLLCLACSWPYGTAVYRCGGYVLGRSPEAELSPTLLSAVSTLMFKQLRSLLAASIDELVAFFETFAQSEPPEAGGMDATPHLHSEDRSHRPLFLVRMLIEAEGCAQSRLVQRAKVRFVRRAKSRIVQRAKSTFCAARQVSPCAARPIHILRSAPAPSQLLRAASAHAHCAGRANVALRVGVSPPQPHPHRSPPTVSARTPSTHAHPQVQVHPLAAHHPEDGAGRD